ncbi:unnamed protein product [Rotaria socialis]|uniref:Dynein assembly factor 3, axonemal n=1 Tax=Rotaria socialis TaxID=392032 RepID=A0A818HBP8_9BILA|nr:unnamed protein product [Rotaria socialis]CAF3383584.1 unnamed protein product [Rotaria socialis]CAF3428319.1 unnamed protein product [Rotaria socialis]CAF3501871.1 unnamed protein product [Rotaria socialis]CAF3530562.1 unnamed protein product [Rotaria socialis]
MDGAGSITFWGYSPSLCLTKYSDKQSEDLPRRLLLIGSGDIRHILHTLALATTPIHIYILESQLEVYARHLLFLQLIFASTDQIGLQEKCEHYLELFANLHINTHTEQYLKEASTQLIQHITNLNGEFQLASNLTVDTTLLKYKEKDFLEGIFQFWRAPPTKQPFPAELAWDGRVRQYLGARYDSRRNAFDWDLHMKLTERGFKRLNTYEYGDWRESGLAFRLTRQDYTQPNRTLASSFVFQSSDGTRQARRGYWGDIVTGPYLSHGLVPVDNDDPKMNAKANDKFVKTGTDVSEYNVLKLLSHLQEQNNQFKIVLLPLNSISDLCTASVERYRHLQFDLIYVGCGLTHHLNEQGEKFSSSIMSEGSQLILESPRFLLDLKIEQIEQLEKRYDELAKNVGCIPQENEEELTANCFKIYKYNRS